MDEGYGVVATMHPQYAQSDPSECDPSGCGNEAFAAIDSQRDAGKHSGFCCWSALRGTLTASHDLHPSGLYFTVLFTNFSRPQLRSNPVRPLKTTQTTLSRKGRCGKNRYPLHTPSGLQPNLEITRGPKSGWQKMRHCSVPLRPGQACARRNFAET